MAKPRNAAESKAAKAQANAARKAAARQRRAQLWQAFTLQRKEDKRLLPYMIGAFLLIVGASVGVGVWAGGFTMFTMIRWGCCWVHWWRSSSSAGEPSERFTAKPKAKPAQPPGRWTTCGASGG